MKAAGDIAGLFMVWWDRVFKRKVEEEGIDMKMYARYVDDENIVSEAVPENDDNSGSRKRRTGDEEIERDR